jgi:XRE family transcriptional regulator, fatty acid utilization regulator
MIAQREPMKVLDMDGPTFAARLRALREAKGWSRTDLARETGINPRVIESWEQARREPGAFEIPKLAAALGCTVADLIADESPAGKRRRKK